MVDDLQRRLARRLDGRIAVERVLADIEIECRQFEHHEIEQVARDALEVEVVVALVDDGIELPQPVQHQPLQFRHVGIFDALALVMRERAEHPADRVAHLAIGIDVGLDDRLAEALIFPVVGVHHPQAQDIGAGLGHHVLRQDLVASDFDILRPSSAMVKPWVMTVS
jgi:hypothetical protein